MLLHKRHTGGIRHFAQRHNLTPPMFSLSNSTSAYLAFISLSICISLSLSLSLSPSLSLPTSSQSITPTSGNVERFRHNTISLLHIPATYSPAHTHTPKRL